MSNDLCSEKMKHKKHYNSFHPGLGYFLHLDEVLSWFDEDPSYFAQVCSRRHFDIASLMDAYPYSRPSEQKSQLKKSDYEHLLKESLSCWKCERDMKNMPQLKAHLQEEWDEEARKEKARLARKRKRDDATSGVSDHKEPEAKKPSPSVT